MDRPACRICGESKYVAISATVAEAPESAIYRCLGCDIVYQYPIMTEREEAQFYASEFDRYMQDRAGPSWKSPEQHFLSCQVEGERRLPLVRHWLSPTDAVLEIGSSTGYFLDDLRGYVSTVTGIEPNVEYARYAQSRGIETLPSVDSLQGRSFDVICLFYVLEHVRDPVGFLDRLSRLLRPGGRLVLEVPNVQDILISTYRVPQFGPFYWQRAHYHYFSHQTLADVCQRSGYRAELTPVQRYDLSNHIVWMMEGRSGGMGRFREIFSPELESAYGESLKRHWLCDTILAVATGMTLITEPQ